MWLSATKTPANDAANGVSKPTSRNRPAAAAKSANPDHRRLIEGGGEPDRALYQHSRAERRSQQPVNPGSTTGKRGKKDCQPYPA
jgi:hypothetical protein